MGSSSERYDFESTKKINIFQTLKVREPEKEIGFHLFVFVHGF